jgi:pimeloyl-ACP methyl ester carboxylesterase
MYTPEKGRNKGQTVDFFNLDSTLKALEMDMSRPFWTVVHGFGGDWPKPWVYPMVDALLSTGNNVLVVRWSKGSAAPDYFRAASDTRVMGAVIARILNRMTQLNSLDLGNSNLVGFSLGAHVAGFAGARLPGLKRIVGLDPAGPLYADGDPLSTTPETRLNYTDAKFVQCIHTDGLGIWEGGAGTTQQFGDIDFLANGGEIQPGCGPPFAEASHDLLHFNCNYT